MCAKRAESGADPLASLLDDGGCIVLDGGLASELQARGCDLDDPLWSARTLLEAPAQIYQVHRAYFRAGAQCAITASYQASAQGFAARGLDLAQSLQLIRLSAELAQHARADHLRENPAAGPLLVAGSIGPYGACLGNGSEYRGDYCLPCEQMLEFHRPRMIALVQAGVDLLACETQPSAAEIDVLLQLLAQFPDQRAWFALTLRDAAHLSDGTPLAEVAARISASTQVVALGVNCVTPELVEPALQQLAVHTALPLLAYPNAGGHYDAISKHWHPAHGATLASQVLAWRRAGARLIGGCCRTTPDDIAAVAARLRTPP